MRMHSLLLRCSSLLLSLIFITAGFSYSCAMPPSGESELSVISENDQRKLIQMLYDNGVITREQYETLMRDAADSDRGFDLLDDDDDFGYTQTDIRTRRYRVRSADGRDLFRLRGRLYLDGAFLMLDDNKNTVDSNQPDRGDLADYGTIIRNARLGAEGVMYEDWLWRLELDFRDTEIRFRGSYLEYNGFRPLRIRAGNIKAPIGMEWMTSRNRNTFLERAASLDAYKPSWALGLNIEYRGNRFNVAGAILGGDDVARNRNTNEGYAFSGRATVAPYYTGTAYAHLGAGAYYRVNSFRHQEARGFDREFTDLRLRTRIGTRAIDGRFIGENDIEDALDHSVFNFEGAFGIGPVSFQGEFTTVNVTRDTGNPDLNLGGYYVQASWFITGESKTYRPERGNFGAIIPNRNFQRGFGPGAIELALRFSHVDSIDQNYDGGKMDHFTAGINWYFNREMRMMFNYMYLDAERANGKRSKGSVLALRLAYEF